MRSFFFGGGVLGYTVIVLFVMLMVNDDGDGDDLDDDDGDNGKFMMLKMVK